MNEYRLAMVSALQTLQWECTFHQPSDATAVEYAKQALSSDMAARGGAIEVNLFCLTPEQYHVATLVFDAPPVRANIVHARLTPRE